MSCGSRVYGTSTAAAVGRVVFYTAVNSVQQYSVPANNKQLFGVSLRFLFAGPTAGHLPISGFLSTEGFESLFCT